MSGGLLFESTSPSKMGDHLTSKIVRVLKFKEGSNCQSDALHSRQKPTNVPSLVLVALRAVQVKVDVPLVDVVDRVLGVVEASSVPRPVDVVLSEGGRRDK